MAGADLWTDLLKQAGRLGMLAFTLWREVRHEPPEVKRAVAYVVVTRAEKGGWWGSSVLGVIGAPKQFSGLTHPQDPQLTWFPKSENPEWVACLQAAAEALYELKPNPAPGATYYYTPPLKKVPAAWGKVEHVADIGVVHFYKERS